MKFKFNRIKSATKFVCVKTSSGKVVVESFLYRTVIDVGGKLNPSFNLIYQIDPPLSTQANFDVFARSASAVRDSEKCSIISL